MLLSKTDVERLERLGYPRERFVRFDRTGFIKLRNRKGCCVFYDAKGRRCKVYPNRPQGCRIYPVIYDEMKGIVIDDSCQARATVTAHEKAEEGLKVFKLLKKIDSESQKLHHSD